MAVVLLLGPIPSFSMLHIIVPAIGLGIEIIIILMLILIVYNNIIISIIVV